MRLKEFGNVSNEALCHKISRDHNIKKYEMGEACGMHMVKRKAYIILIENREGRG
jgi:hypothetical protein